MGNWKHRPRRRFYRQDNTPRYPPRYHEPESSFSEYCNDGVPLWEKKFCTSIGFVSWRKIVDAKKLLCYNDNVLKWNDSAGEEAFQNAKRRYWAEINCHYCDISAPDPDAYIDQINWNPFIDPELIRDAEKAYFAPNNEEKDGTVGHENRTAPSEGCNMDPCKADNPWECNNDSQRDNGLRDLLGWGQLVSKVDESRNLNDKGNNPWENSITQGNESGKHNSWGDNRSRDWNTGNNSWGDNRSRDWNTGNNSWGDNRFRDWYTGNNSWGHSCPGTSSKKGDGWGDFKQNSLGRNQWDNKKFSFRDNSWEHNFVRDSGAPNDKGWGDRGRNSWGSKQWENPKIGSKKLDFKQTSSSERVLHSGSRKREGSHQYISGNKSSKFQPEDYQKNHCWSGNPNKRVSFALE